MAEIPAEVAAELARLRAENARLLRLMKMTPSRRLRPGSGQAGFSRRCLGWWMTGRRQRLMHQWWDGAARNGEEDLGGTVPSGTAAISWGPHRLDVFYRGPNDHLLHRWFPAW